MALKKTVSTVHGFVATDSYHRVEAVRLKDKSTIEFHVRSYLDASKPCFSEKIVQAPYSLGGDNPMKQAYIYLKSTDEFSGAEDC